jgi:Zn-dependent protease
VRHASKVADPLARPTFSLFGIPVRVLSSFWIFSLILGVGGATSAPAALRGILTVTAVWFISVLLHELGHALAARRYGLQPSITLHFMGGLTHFEGGRLSRAQSCLVSFAGPAVGLLFGALVFVVARSSSPSPLARDIINSLLYINIGWTIINLLPVIPFDGGHIMASLLGPRRALAAWVISALVAAPAAAAGLLKGSLWIAFIFGSATFSSVGQVRRAWFASKEEKEGVGAELDQIRAAIQRADVPDVLARSEALAGRARTPGTKNAALLAQAWAHATAGRSAVATGIVEKLEREAPPDLYFFAVLEDALGAPERARALLEAGRQQGWKRSDTTRLLIDLYARDGQMARATDVATEELDVLSRDEARAVLSAAMAQGAHRSAAGLARRLFEIGGDPSDGLEEARAWALAGDTGQALALLEQLLQRGDAKPANRPMLRTDALRNDAAFQSLRGLARFEQLLEPRAEETPG